MLVVFVGWGPSPVFAAKKWRQYTDCRLIPNPSNDGDSFHVKAGNIKTRTYLFRLYFVDTPEDEKSLPERLQEQADYFGITDPADVIKAGKAATKFTEQFLKDGFTVHSRLSDALGRSKKKRDYAMVLNAAGDDLGLELVRNGLARVHGMSTDLGELKEYGSRSAGAWQRRLRQVELEAKQNNRGAWALAGGPTSRLDALMAPREVDEQNIVLAQPVYLYSRDPANTIPLGTMGAGVTVRVLKGVTPDKALVRFTTSSGQVYEGLARFVDLGL